MSYQTGSKRSPPFWLLIGARKTQVFWHQAEARTAATVWNWSGQRLSPGSLLAVLYFSSFHIYIFRPFRLSLAPFICPWVSEDGDVIRSSPVLYREYSIQDENLFSFTRRGVNLALRIFLTSAGLNRSYFARFTTHA